MVTAEAALALPALILVALLASWLVLAGLTELRCVNAAELGARALARGEAPDQVRALLARAAPGALVQVLSDAATVTVTVRSAVPRPGGLAGLLPVLTTTGSAVAAWER